MKKNGDKTLAISKVEPPTDTTHLKQFIGMVTFYNAFIPDITKRLHPLYCLLRDNEKFIWNLDCQRAFVDINDELIRF